MQKIFVDSRKLDTSAQENFALSEELMMENAASALEAAVVAHIGIRRHTLILCGCGNNGADGYALARRISCREIPVSVFAVGEPKTQIARIQRERAEKIGVEIIELDKIEKFINENKSEIGVIVDCIFGVGLRLPIPAETAALISSANKIEAYKIACDVPSGLDALGNSRGTVFTADETITMGALKISLFSDEAKDFCGNISVGSLGISRENFEKRVGDFFLLEEKDLRLPFRKKQNVHKGCFGHLAVVSGEKHGAAQITGRTALGFGAGLVTVVGGSASDMELLYAAEFPKNTTAVALGMGLGRDYQTEETFNFLNTNEIPCVIDADIFYKSEIREFLKFRSKKNIATIITPHPKEFSVLLKNCSLGEFSISEIAQERIALTKKFITEFQNIVLLLKGANVIIAQKKYDSERIFINNLGTSALAKGGSGDTLTGLAGALLAQGQDALEAAKNASLAHALASRKIKNDFSLTPLKLIQVIENEIC